MPKNVVIRINGNQFTGIVAVLDEWADDPKLHGLIDIYGQQDLPNNLREVTLEVSKATDYRAWQKFCEEIEQKIPYPF